MGVNKYGDAENVECDVKILNEILARQGSNLLIDVIAEYTGDAANNFKMTIAERETLRTGLVEDLRNALSERT